MIRIIRIGAGPHYGIQCSNFSPVIRDFAKQTPGMSWEPVSKVWVGYLDAVSIVAERSRARGLIINEDVPGKSFVVVPTAYANLRQYQNEGVHFLLAHSQEGCLLADDVGCVASDVKIHINRCGLTRHFTIHEVFERFEKTWRKDLPTFVKSMAPNGDLVLHRMIGVVKKGPKEVVKITLESGRSIRVTPDHEIAVRGGKFVRADKLKRGSVVLTNGLPMCKLCGSKENVATYKYGSYPGHCKKCIYRKLRVKPTWIGGRHSSGDGYVLISGQQDHPYQRQGRVPEHRLVLEKALGRYLTPNEVAHHKNGIKNDNRLENLELLTQREHMRLHGREGGFRHMNGGTAGRGGTIWFTAAEGKVASVEADGIAETYDILCDDPHHNFVANGFVVHNCGKSAQAVTAARAIRQKTVIVCPSFVRGVWLQPKEGEIAKWWPKAKVFGAKATKAQPIEADVDVVVCHYDILYAWVDALIAWGSKVLIIDEGHFLMGSKSRRTTATAKLAEACTHRIMLTATPMTSKPIDMWSPINVISPGRMGKFFSFGVRYGAAHQEQVTPTKTVWKFDGASNLDELQKRLGFFMLRRLKSELSLQLPERTRQFVELEVPRGKIMAPSSAIRSDRILRQALNMAADGKFPHVVSLVQNHLEAGSKVVVGTYRKEVAGLIAEGVSQLHPWKIEVITGEMPQAKRQKAIDSRPDLLCCTIDSTKAGINLSYWNVGVVAELMWVPADLIQWEGRFGRQPGRNVLVQYCIAKGTADDLIRRTVIQKLDRYAEGIGKSDDKLREDLKDLQKEGAASRLQKLYEKLRSLDD